MAEIIVQKGAASDKTGMASKDDVAANTPQDTGLDGEASLYDLRQVQQWWCEARDLCSENRAQRVLDHDYYDSLQWSNAERQELYNRGQAPLVYNKIALSVDWITGTERRTRVDYAVHPRNQNGIQDAKNKEKLLKYLSDVNRTGWERSRAFKDATISGLGWMEQNIRGDSAQDMILDAYVPWQQMWHDPFHRDTALKDCRYLHRRKWVDLDFAISLFPDREAVIRRAARAHLFTDEDLLDDELDLPQPFRRYDHNGAEIVQRRWSSAFPSDGGTTRLRVPLCETWWRNPKKVKKLWGFDHPGVIFDSTNPDHQEAVKSGYASMTDAVQHEIRISIWVPGAMVYRGTSPFKHGNFPFTPVWGKRRSNDGMEYGVVRGVRDAQDDLNHNRSKIKWYSSSAQLFYEIGAIDQDDLQDIRRNLAKPNGEIRLKDGAISLNKFKVERNFEAIKSLTEMQDFAAEHINDGSGVNRDQQGKETNVIAGVAIRAKQEEGGVTTGELFDNNRLMVQLSGEKDLSLVEQYMTLPMQIYIAGAGPKPREEWLTLNQPKQDESGNWSVENDVTANAAKFVVDEQDYKESVRQAQSEALWELVSKLPIEAQMQVLDLLVDGTDIVNKDELVRRFRKMNGQPDPDAEDDPAAVAAQRLKEQQAAQQQAADKARADAAVDAKTGVDAARAEELKATAKHKNLLAKQAALDLAAGVHATAPLAPAADALFDGTQPAAPPPQAPLPPQDNVNGTTGQ